MLVPESIESGRLVLRRLRDEDSDAFVSFLTDPGATSEFLFEDVQKDVPGARAYFRTILASYTAPSPFFLLAIERRETPGLMGVCGLSGLSTDHTFECFCGLVPSNRGCGYATEAIGAIIDHVFTSCREAVIREFINPANLRSLAMAKRLGFRYEGSGSHPIHGDRSEVFALRGDEWSSRSARSSPGRRP